MKATVGSLLLVIAMGKLHIMCQAFLVTLLVSILATSLAERMLINDGESLMKYLYVLLVELSVLIPTFNLTTLPSLLMDNIHFV